MTNIAQELVKLAKELTGAGQWLFTGQYFDSRVFGVHKTLLDKQADAEEQLTKAREALELAERRVADAEREAESINDSVDEARKRMRIVAQKFANAARQQSGKNFPMSESQHDDDELYVDMENWPDGEDFGPWFEQMMQANGVEVGD